MTNHPITPPPELVRQWYLGAKACPSDLIVKGPGWWATDVAAQAAQWGADQELAACCEWLKSVGLHTYALHTARRSKPPSLKEQALAALEDNDIDVYLIRRALEALPND